MNILLTISCFASNLLKELLDGEMRMRKLRLSTAWRKHIENRPLFLSHSLKLSFSSTQNAFKPIISSRPAVCILPLMTTQHDWSYNVALNAELSLVSRMLALTTRPKCSTILASQLNCFDCAHLSSRVYASFAFVASVMDGFRYACCDVSITNSGGGDYG